MSPALFINNQWIEGEGEALTSINPVDQEALWQGICASDDQVGLAVESARKALRNWSGKTVDERYTYIEKFTNLVGQHKDEFARLITKENGKALWDAESEVAAMMGKAAISKRAYDDRTGSHTKKIAQGELNIQHKPFGVLAIFGPYNFPAHLPNGHVIPALLAGNTVVFKASELTPAVAEFTVRLWQKAGLPAGVINLVQGGKDTGSALSKNKQLDGILFTGSAQTGCYFHKEYAGQPEKILVLEMGGNNPLLIDSVSDIHAAIYISLFSAFVSSGQRCTCARRVILPNSIWGDVFLQKLLTATKQLTVADGLQQPQPFMGAVISSEAVNHLQKGIVELERIGGTILLKSEYKNPQKTIMTPAIVDMSKAASFSDKELFGPVLQVYRYDDFDQGIDQCNKTAYGLAAGIITDDSLLAQTFRAQIRAGIVNCNKPLTGASSEAPFGGVGLSGNGRPSAYYAADYCAYPVASISSSKAELPTSMPPGMDHV